MYVLLRLPWSIDSNMLSRGSVLSFGDNHDYILDKQYQCCTTDDEIMKLGNTKPNAQAILDSGLAQIAELIKLHNAEQNAKAILDSGWAQIATAGEIVRPSCKGSQRDSNPSC